MDLTDLNDVRRGRGLYLVETGDDGRPRYRRPVAPPVGAVEPIVLPAVVPSPHDLLGAPEPFPLAWIETTPSWLEPAEGVRVAVEGPEVGRAAGYVRLHDSCYQDGTGACKVPPEVPYDEFHRGRLPVVDEEGRRVDAWGGVITIVGGHSLRNGQGATNHREAIEHLDRPEFGKLRGVLVEDDIGLLFLGGARPDMTRTEATLVNVSDTSGEWWPIYEPGPDGRPRLVGNDMIGIALVVGGAFRKKTPDRFRVMAAALGGDDLTDDEKAMVLATDAVAAGEPAEPGDDDAAAAADNLARMADVVAITPAPIVAHPSQLATMVASLVSAELARLRDAGSPMLASIDDTVADLESRVGTLETDRDKQRADHDALEARFTAFQVEQTDETMLTLPEAVAGTEDDLRALEAQVAQIVADRQAEAAAQQSVGYDAGNAPAPTEGAAVAV